jgi:hypothetical protein
LNVSIKEMNITLNQDRSRFYYDDKKDGLDLSRREVAFGRFRPVSVGNWIVVFIMIILFPLCYLGATSDYLLEPGPTWHGDMAAYHQALEGLDEDSQDCDACHDTFTGTPASKCLSCHQDDVGPQDMHPFYSTADDWGDACVKCHIDHRGTHELALIARPAKDTCGECHAADMQPSGKRTSSAASIKPTNVGVKYNTFAHADHMNQKLGGRNLSCADCHKQYDVNLPMDERAIEGDRTREFAPVDYEACMACHSGDNEEIKNLEGAWHGTDDKDNCLSCHSEVNQPDLKMVAGFATARTFTLSGRSHTQEMQAMEAAGGKKCADCHRNGIEIEGGRTFADSGFKHVTHAFDLNPKDNSKLTMLTGTLDAPSRGQCSFCHADVMQQATLEVSGPHQYAKDKSCTECHNTGEVVETFAKRDPIMRSDFPHSLHMKVEGGCFTCHEFDDKDPIKDVITKQSAKNCIECHQTHQEIGGGHCADCHKVGDGVYGNAPLPWERTVDKTYSHYSPGHRTWTNEGKCADCHGDSIWQTKSIDEIQIPAENSKACRDCHLKERFHWR